MIITRTAVSCTFLKPVCFLLVVLLGGCGWCPTEVRYDENVYSYSSPPSGIKSTSSRDETNTARYSSGKDDGVTARYASPQYEGGKIYTSPTEGIKSSSPQLEGVTAYYISRDGGKEKVSPKGNMAVSKNVGSPPPPDFSLVIEVSNVLFEFDKYVIRKPYQPELDKWADYLSENQQVTAVIYGHTDSIGTEPYNQKLAENRAKAVVNYLIDKGVNSTRLTIMSLGETQPVAPNTTREGRRQNRRVEIEF